MATIKAIYNHKCAIIRLSGELDDNSLVEICDQIDLAIGYYHLRKIDLHVMSMSCSIKSIDYYLAKLRHWTSQAVVGTLATSVITDFGIDLISSGTLGYRRALRSAVFQNTGVSGTSIGFKQKFLEPKNDSNAYFLNDSPISELHRDYECLTRDRLLNSKSGLQRLHGKRIISPTEAIALELIDCYEDDFRLCDNFLGQR